MAVDIAVESLFTLCGIFFMYKYEVGKLLQISPSQVTRNLCVFYKILTVAISSHDVHSDCTYFCCTILKWVTCFRTSYTAARNLFLDDFQMQFARQFLKSIFLNSVIRLCFDPVKTLTLILSSIRSLKMFCIDIYFHFLSVWTDFIRGRLHLTFRSKSLL